MEVLTKKYGPLPGYGWVLIAAGGIYFYMKMRGGSSASATGTDMSSQDPGNPDATSAGQGYTDGFAQGYNQGFYGGQIAPPVTTPPVGSQYCRNVKDPSGKSQRVCGQGAFIADAGNKGYKWVQGATRTIFGYGRRGNPFYTQSAWRAAQARTVKARTPTPRRPTNGRPQKGAGSGTVAR